MAAWIIGLAIVAWLKHRYGWVGGAIRIVPVYIVMNALSLVVHHGGVARIAFLVKLRRAFTGVADDVLLIRSGRQVSIVAYDAGRGEETVRPAYRGGPSWPGGPRLAAKVRRSVSRQLTVRCLILSLITLPLFGYSIWAGLLDNWVWLMVSLLVVIDQIFVVVLLPQSLVTVLEGVFDSL